MNSTSKVESSTPSPFSSPTKKKKEELQINGTSPLEVMRVPSLDYHAKCLNEFPKAVKLYYKAKDDPTFDWEALYGELSAAKEGVLNGKIDHITSFEELGFELESLLSTTETGWVIFRTPKSKVCTFHILNPKETFKELFDFNNEELMFCENILLKRTKTSDDTDQIELISLLDQKVLWNFPLDGTLRHILGKSTLFLYDESLCYCFDLKELKNFTPPIFSGYTHFEARVLGGHVVENQEYAHRKNQYSIDDKFIFIARKDNQQKLLIWDNAQRKEIVFNIPNSPDYDLDQNTCLEGNYVVVRFISKQANPQAAMVKIIVEICNLENRECKVVSHHGQQCQGLFLSDHRIYSFVMLENGQRKKFLSIDLKSAEIKTSPMEIPFDYLSFDGGVVIGGLIAPTKESPVDKAKFFNQSLHRFSGKYDGSIRSIFSEKVIIQRSNGKYFIGHFAKESLLTPPLSSKILPEAFFKLPSDIHHLFFHFLERSELMKISLASKQMNFCIEWEKNVRSRFPKAMKLVSETINDHSQIDWKQLYSNLAQTSIRMQNGLPNTIISLLNIGIDYSKANIQCLSSNSGWVAFSYETPNKSKRNFKFHVLRPEETMRKVSCDLDCNLRGITNEHLIMQSTTCKELHVVDLKTDVSWKCDLKNELLKVSFFGEKSILIYKNHVELRKLNQDEFCCPTPLFSSYKNFEFINQLDSQLVLFAEDPNDRRRKILIWDFQTNEELLPLDLSLCQRQKPKQVLFLEEKCIVQFLSKGEGAFYKSKLLFFNKNTQQPLSIKEYDSLNGDLSIIDRKAYLFGKKNYFKKDFDKLNSPCHAFHKKILQAEDIDGVKVYDNKIIPNKLYFFYQNILETTMLKAKKPNLFKIVAILFGKVVVCYENELLLMDFAPNKIDS